MNARRILRFIRCRDGATAVEFALVALPMTALIFGTVEFGRAHWAVQALQDVAVRAARCAGVVQDECAEKGAFSPGKTKEYAVETAKGLGLVLDAEMVDVDKAASCGGMSGFSRVRVSYVFRTPLEGVLESLGKGTTLRAESCFPNQGA